MTTQQTNETKNCYVPAAASILYTYDSTYSRDPIAASAELNKQTQRCLETPKDPCDLPALRKLLKRVQRDSDSLFRVAELAQAGADYILTSEDTGELPELIWLNDNIYLTINAISRAAAQLRDVATNVRWRIDCITHDI